jgi:hypothetical protein
MTEEENRRLTVIENTVGKIYDCLEGKDGLITTVALQGMKIDGIPSPTTLKAYAFAGGGLTLFIGFLGYTVVKMCV